MNKLLTIGHYVACSVHPETRRKSFKTDENTNIFSLLVCRHFLNTSPSYCACAIELLPQQAQNIPTTLWKFLPFLPTRNEKLFCFYFFFKNSLQKELHNINCQNMLLGIGLSKLTALPKVIKGDYSSHISASGGSTTELQIFKF